MLMVTVNNPLPIFPSEFVKTKGHKLDVTQCGNNDDWALSVEVGLKLVHYKITINCENEIQMSVKLFSTQDAYHDKCDSKSPDFPASAKAPLIQTNHSQPLISYSVVLNMPNKDRLLMDAARGLDLKMLSLLSYGIGKIEGDFNEFRFTLLRPLALDKASNKLLANSVKLSSVDGVKWVNDQEPLERQQWHQRAKLPVSSDNPAVVMAIDLDAMIEKTDESKIQHNNVAVKFKQKPFDNAYFTDFVRLVQQKGHQIIVITSQLYSYSDIKPIFEFYGINISPNNFYRIHKAHSRNPKEFVQTLSFKNQTFLFDQHAKFIGVSENIRHWVAKVSEPAQADVRLTLKLDLDNTVLVYNCSQGRFKSLDVVSVRKYNRLAVRTVDTAEPEQYNKIVELQRRFYVDKSALSIIRGIQRIGHQIHVVTAASYPYKCIYSIFLKNRIDLPRECYVNRDDMLLSKNTASKARYIALQNWGEDCLLLDDKLDNKVGRINFLQATEKAIPLNSIDQDFLEGSENIVMYPHCNESWLVQACSQKQSHMPQLRLVLLAEDVLFYFGLEENRALTQVPNLTNIYFDIDVAKQLNDFCDRGHQLLLVVGMGINKNHLNTMLNNDNVPILNFDDSQAVGFDCKVVTDFFDLSNDKRANMIFNERTRHFADTAFSMLLPRDQPFPIFTATQVKK